MWVIIAGLAALVAVAIAAIFHYSSAADVVTAVSPVTAVIAALVGAYFGVRGATLAQQKANEGIQAAQSQPPAGMAPYRGDGAGGAGAGGGEAGAVGGRGVRRRRA
ncbi:MAG: hypothetical protein ACTHM1_01660 [Solirubrobacteraceae bacterium]